MHVHVFDALVVGVAVAAELEIVLRDLAGPRWLLLSAVWLYTLPLLARRRWPLAAPVFVICLQVLTSFVDVPGSVRESMGVVATDTRPPLVRNCTLLAKWFRER